MRGAIISLVLAVSAAVIPVSAQALPQSYHLDIPREPLDGALKDLAQQTGLQIARFSDTPGGSALVGPLSGDMPVGQALTSLLSSSGLTYKVVNDRTIAVVTPTTQVSASAASAQTTPSSSSSADGQKEGKKDSSGDFRLAQATSEQDQSAVSVEDTGKKATPKDELQEVHPDTPEILIKGSKIMNVDVKRTEDDAQPYTIFTSQQIEQSGATNAEEFLKQQLTMNTAQQTAAQGVTSFNNGTTSAIDLRGLGANETLVLIDGRRAANFRSNPFFGDQQGQPDINGIPISAIERIEVLPSSASAIYGGAAMGGVVNIILKKNFQGGDFGYSYDNVTRGSAPIRAVDGSYGTSLGDPTTSTQILVGGHYSDGSPLPLGDRANLFDRGISEILANSPGYLYYVSAPFSGASPNIASADGSYLFGPQYPGGFEFVATPLVLKNGTPLNSAITSVPAGTAPGANLTAGLLRNAGTYNVSPSPGTGIHGLQSPVDVAPLTKSVYSTIRQDLPRGVEIFTEFSTNSNSSRTGFNPISSEYFTVPSAAATNPFQQDVLVSFPSELSVPVITNSVTQSATVGAKAPLGSDWNAELDYTWSRNSFRYASFGADGTAIAAALSTGQINPFADTIEYPPQDLASYLGPDSYSESTTLNDLALRASGSFGSLPGGRATLTLGLEHRKEGTTNADYSQVFPLNPGNDIEGVFFGRSQSTNSLYAETLLPLVGPVNQIPMVDALELQAAGRSEHYTIYNGTPFEYSSPALLLSLNPPQGVSVTQTYTSTNPTVAIKYRPISDVTVRMSYATAFLPPTPSQLAENPTPLCGFPCTSIVDPKNGQTYLIDTFGLGSASLKPQTSTSWDFGLIFEPKAQSIQGLRLSADYYLITQPNDIVGPTAQQVIDDPSLVGRVTRDPSTGLITKVDTSYLNATEYRTSGWDSAIDYSKATSLGAFAFHAGGTFIRYDLRQLSIGSPFVEFAGFPNDGGEAKIKANAALNWSWRSTWKAGWMVTYFGNYRQEFTPGSPSAILDGFSSPIVAAQGSSVIPSQTYHDIYVSYTFDQPHPAERLLKGTTLQVSIKNLFNTTPPFDAANLVYFGSLYGNARLREYQLSIRKSL